MCHSTETVRRVRAKAIDIRADILEMIPHGKVGHLGGSCSVADVTAALYFEHMKVYEDPKDPTARPLHFQQGSRSARTVCLPC